MKVTRVAVECRNVAVLQVGVSGSNAQPSTQVSLMERKPDCFLQIAEAVMPAQEVVPFCRARSFIT